MCPPKVLKSRPGSTQCRQLLAAAIGDCEGESGFVPVRITTDAVAAASSMSVEQIEIGGPVTARFRHTPNGLKIQGRNSETLSVVLEQLGIAHMHSAWGVSETLANRQIESTGFPGSWRGYRGRSMLP